MRAIETVDRSRALWSDADRTWASRAAAEVVGAAASPEAYVARRAGFALERLRKRHAALSRTLDALSWRPWITPVVVLAAFGLGMVVDQIGAAGRINILAPPVLGLLAWNLAVYAALLIDGLRRLWRPASLPQGPLRRAASRLAGFAPRTAPTTGEAPLALSLASFTADWTHLASPLYAARAARLLHLGAAALALGVVAGLYLRGIAFEYRASWQSTFLDATQVHALLSLALAPGSAITGIPVPTADAIAAIREGATPASENAARWLHLLAATVGVVVIAPRLLLAIFSGWLAQRRGSRMKMPLDEPYFRRLLRGFREGPLRVRVVPYSFTPPPAAIAGLEAILARAFGSQSEIVVVAPIPYGAEDELPDTIVPANVHAVVGLFNLTATPERESHGTFASALHAAAGAARDCVAVVDESSFRLRWPDEAARLDGRRAVWRDLFSARRVPAVFVDLSSPDLDAAESALDAALEPAPR